MPASKHEILCLGGTCLIHGACQSILIFSLVNDLKQRTNSTYKYIINSTERQQAQILFILSTFTFCIVYKLITSLNFWGGRPHYVCDVVVCVCAAALQYCLGCSKQCAPSIREHVHICMLLEVLILDRILCLTVLSLFVETTRIQQAPEFLDCSHCCWLPATAKALSQQTPFTMSSLQPYRNEHINFAKILLS